MTTTTAVTVSKFDSESDSEMKNHDMIQPLKESMKMKLIEKMNDLDPRYFVPVVGILDSIKLWVPFAEGNMQQEAFLKLFFQRNTFSAKFKFVEISHLKILLGMASDQDEKQIEDDFGVPTYQALLKMGIGNRAQKKLIKLWQNEQNHNDFALVVMSLWIFHKKVPLEYQSHPYISLEFFGSRVTFGPYCGATTTKNQTRRRSQISIYIRGNKTTK